MFYACAGAAGGATLEVIPWCVCVRCRQRGSRQWRPWRCRRTFPPSSSARSPSPPRGPLAAQEAFLTGVKALHSFQFDEAAVAFQQAQKADPNFALAYWGEAMSHNHPLWAQQDLDKAKQALEKLAPTHEARLAKAKLPKEKAFLEAMQALYYGPGDKLARDIAYSAALARMYEQWSDDHEVATWYALSLLGTVRPGDTGFRRQALAASIAEADLRQEPEPPRRRALHHPLVRRSRSRAAGPRRRQRLRQDRAVGGARAPHAVAHLRAARDVAQVALSNVVAYKAAVDLNAQMKLAEGREDFHTLGWLGYANLMMGKFDEAKDNVESAKAAADRNPQRPRHPRRLPGHARALHPGNRPVGEARTAGAGRAAGGR